MKKSLFLSVCISAFLIMGINIFLGYDGNCEKINGSEKNITLLKKLSGEIEAERIGIVTENDTVFLGIELKKGIGNRDMLRENAKKILSREYKNEKIIVEIETKEAKKIIEIANDLKKGVSDIQVLSEIDKLKNK